MNPYRFSLGALVVIALALGALVFVAQPFGDAAYVLLTIGSVLGIIWLAVGAVCWEIRQPRFVAHAAAPPNPGSRAAEPGQPG